MRRLPAKEQMPQNCQCVSYYPWFYIDLPAKLSKCCINNSLNGEMLRIARMSCSVQSCHFSLLSNCTLRPSEALNSRTRTSNLPNLKSAICCHSLARLIDSAFSLCCCSRSEERR